MKLTIERFDGDPRITIEDFDETVSIHIDGAPDSLALVLPQAAYERLTAAVIAAVERRNRAGVRVGIEDVSNLDD